MAFLIFFVKVSKSIIYSIKRFNNINYKEIELKYQKKTLIEHILHRPDSYVGSLQKSIKPMWVYDGNINKIVEKPLDFVPGLYKIFDEILVNAIDNKSRDNKTSYIKININQSENEISIANDGLGLPVILHSAEQMYIPTLIFGHLLTSSNFDDSIDKTTGGRNGFGAKLCNLFSDEFTIETSSQLSGLSFLQTWKNNMQHSTEPIIVKSQIADFTKVTFRPDLSKFSMDSLDSNIVSLFHRRAIDVAATIRDVDVYFNDSLIPVHSFEQYVALYDNEKGSSNQFVHHQFNDCLEIAVAMSRTDSFNQISFVNGIHTRNGGLHVDYITNKLTALLVEVVKTQFPDDAYLIRSNLIKNCLTMFVNAKIVNPTFESQSKECLTSLPNKFGYDIQFSDKFVRDVANCGIFDKMEVIIAIKKKTQLFKKNHSTSIKLNIPKLDDAMYAGTAKSQECTLILTEGDSAKSFALSGVSVIGRNFYGIFPLRGKTLNVRDSGIERTTKNIEFKHLVSILGLHFKRKYNTAESLQSLRYGKIMIMADQDPDGSHIKGLIINFFHYYWPELLQHNFIEQFITPIIKAFKNNNVLSFYSLSEYTNWKSSIQDINKWKIKYYKGLGTSTSTEAKEYFNNFEQHRKTFYYSGSSDDQSMILAFDKLQSENRKSWLQNWMENRKERQDKDLIADNIYDKDIQSISYSDFINKELVVFSILDNERSIPSLMDGLKPAQRKVLFTCLKRNLVREIKVSQLAGSVAELSSYHHGESSLLTTINCLAQDFVGSNNINILLPIGQFGTRVFGGKDCASGRYIFTKLSPITKLIYHPQDDHLLTYLTDNNQPIEPKWYAPIIPMILVNGCEGIGTGFKSIIPNFNPLDIIKNLRLLINGLEVEHMIPWYRNFKGTIMETSPNKYSSCGNVNRTSSTTCEITELPIRCWTQGYKEEVLNSFIIRKHALIKKYEEHSTDTAVKVIIHCHRNKVKRFENADLNNLFKLIKCFSLDNMVLFDENGAIRKYQSAEEILSHFYHIRLSIYEKRQMYMENVLFAETRKLENQLRFIQENIDGTLDLRTKKEKDMIELMIQRNYDSDPLKKSSSMKNMTIEDNENNVERHFDFNYILSMPLKCVSEENLQFVTEIYCIS